jgi:hypothetical protein
MRIVHVTQTQQTEATMPNWAANVITITGPIAMIRTLHGGAVDGKFCHTVCPVPQELTDTVSGYVGRAGSDEQAAHDTQQQRNLDQFGYRNWYDFCVDEWGVKWDMGSADSAIFSDNGDGTATMTLNEDSAWSPPIAIFEKLHEQGLDVLAYYYEPGMAFCGKWHNGVDEYYEIRGDSAWVEANIPNEIDEVFGISENMAIWEEESKEESEEE